MKRAMDQNSNLRGEHESREHPKGVQQGGEKRKKKKANAGGDIEDWEARAKLNEPLPGIK
jgi:hypothetical protein